MKQLIIGGARSGKSKMAQNYASQWQSNTQGEVIVIVTAQNKDGAMAKRIAHHQANRPPHWQTVESHLALASTLQRHSQADNLIMVDCLTLWLSNVLLHDAEQSTNQYPVMKRQLIDTIKALSGEIVLIGNEVGQGVVPMGALCREFVDQSGWLHQSIAECVDKVTVSIAGLPMVIKERA
ncbi:bifunctional adenosylcobinamide kinase/adenosylcobinamide-phosphate guanylyltransferase [Shewanella sp. 10N.286.52.C2]|uniref:bifunctional adenosylcobinamide kinase/adenosylcobinamide-phosphate guanylyltransferase n=1 Tax=unclassified Shewanella TaxID=196818 RepID=UPI000C856E0C|nr:MULTISPECIES: bifunctional adenosylcobinamide kinase/adenosylcobinamide-phosphate guanylyltransferase [unclassified Shewanella]MDO6777214.1 bifunctional adenosylcobinamide kinase/adenosylcobinamide-phosphate guanylyltransferase [Shewanella sp. 3_MG-2023]PMG30932.1 bifunctional adenosylcobinamide kinase/adenosylcobinamide-phosphate guanylyltransferase [Shewanella sp. 10N.286.52.C2]